MLLAVRACGLNQIDLLTRDGQTPKEVPLPHISGTEVAGNIVALGDGVADWRIGARVVVDPIIACRHCSSCVSGQTNMCRHSRVFGVQTPGGYAEYVAAPARQLLALPDELDYAAAAAMAVTGPTAWHMLRDRANVSLGDDVLVIAAGSGIGVLGMQIAAAAGARVIATAGSRDKMQRALELGASFAVDHGDPSWPDKVRDFTGGVASISCSSMLASRPGRAASRRWRAAAGWLHAAAIPASPST
ncbi:alcohol dehydrogenase catalytic domain-containing protein [Arvimicrobium flavum]|uniref:alcohol dehydrogenase catalytic domain-containing protein n=1 Tax=Arvimicrobium flavum TaxID=3393320 RepID=UPI00237C2911|nr:alcohol dehydrogenase catalytic domain-containing protein [Mesorhizobium shangrilense]